MSFDILTATIAMPSCAPHLHNLIISVLNKEKNIIKNNRFRMDDVAKVAQERQYVERICLRSYPNCISTN